MKLIQDVDGNDYINASFVVSMESFTTILLYITLPIICHKKAIISYGMCAIIIELFTFKLFSCIVIRLMVYMEHAFI